MSRPVCHANISNVSWQRTQGDVASRVGLKHASSRFSAYAAAAPRGVIGLVRVRTLPQLARFRFAVAHDNHRHRVKRALLHPINE